MNSFVIQNNTNITDHENGFDLSNEDKLIIRTVIQSIAGVSLIGLIIVEIIFCVFKSLRSFAFELVMWLCLSNIVYNITFFIPINGDELLMNFSNKKVSLGCTLQALISTMSDLSSMLWTTIIGFTAYYSLKNYNNFNDRRGLFRAIFFSIAFILPLIFTLM
jgi:hypothetical protein